MNKINVGILFGGKSSEHQVSLMSAVSIIQAIDKSKYELTLIGIDKVGNWMLFNDINSAILHNDDPSKISLNKSDVFVGFVPNRQNKLINTQTGEDIKTIDVVFPILHGTNGEDGSIQGFLKLINIPFVGPSILGSAVGMNKDVQKRLLRDANIPVTKFKVYNKHDQIDYQDIKDLKLPLFVKPANSGSSVGVSKVENKDQFYKAVEMAFLNDNKILIEEGVIGREIEVSVLGNEKIFVSVPGEIKSLHEFYSYKAKYLDPNGAQISIPADIGLEASKNIRKLALETYKVLGLEGMARVDLFLTKNNKIFINEVNTIPGFTKISMYPKLLDASGISYSKLIDKLIQLAIERFMREKILVN